MGVWEVEACLYISWEAGLMWFGELWWWFDGGWGWFLWRFGVVWWRFGVFWGVFGVFQWTAPYTTVVQINFLSHDQCATSK